MKIEPTGRTTRMLEDAKEKALEGRAVYVIAWNDRDRCRMEQMLGRDALNLGIKIECLSDHLWHCMSLRAAHPNCIVLVDHYAIEQQFAEVLEMLHRYDQKVASADNRGAD